METHLKGIRRYSSNRSCCTSSSRIARAGQLFESGCSRAPLPVGWAGHWAPCAGSTYKWLWRTAWNRLYLCCLRTPQVLPLAWILFLRNSSDNHPARGCLFGRLKSGILSGWTLGRGSSIFNQGARWLALSLREVKIGVLDSSLEPRQELHHAWS